MNTAKLKALYQNTSKHSNYQILPTILRSIVDANDLDINSRYEAERMDFLKSHISFNDKKVVDVGGNTGYFTFEAIAEGAKEVDHIEGNIQHSEFVQSAAEHLNLNINVLNKYLNFDDNSVISPETDIVLLFNVIHHLGDDFGDQNISVQNAKEMMAKSINFFQDKTDILVLQMGFCWKGNRNLLLFENGTKDEMINFVKAATQNSWDILAIGVAELEENRTVYNLLDKKNIKRNNELGEFRNRPIFILKSKKKFDRAKELSFLNELVSDYKDSSPYSEIKKDILFDLICKSLKDNRTQNKKALQLGCSHGYETERLAQLHDDLTVIDESSYFINKLKETNKNASIKFVFALFEDLAEKLVDKYDIVYCNYVLEHVFDSRDILSQLTKVLNPGGFLFVVVPNANALSRRLAKEMGLIENLLDLTANDHQHGHRRVYTYDSLVSEITDAGFEIVHSQGVIFKILADFQLNTLLQNGFLTSEHIWAMQALAAVEENVSYSDSIFIMAKNRG